MGPIIAGVCQIWNLKGSFQTGRFKKQPQLHSVTQNGQGTERPVLWQPWERHIQALQLALKLPT